MASSVSIFIRLVSLPVWEYDGRLIDFRSWADVSSINLRHRADQVEWSRDVNATNPTATVLPTESSAPTPRYPLVLHRGIPLATFGPISLPFLVVS